MDPMKRCWCSRYECEYHRPERPKFRLFPLSDWFLPAYLLMSYSKWGRKIGKAWLPGAVRREARKER